MWDQTCSSVASQYHTLQQQLQAYFTGFCDCHSIPSPLPESLSLGAFGPIDHNFSCDSLTKTLFSEYCSEVYPLYPLSELEGFSFSPKFIAALIQLERNPQFYVVQETPSPSPPPSSPLPLGLLQFDNNDMLGAYDNVSSLVLVSDCLLTT